MSHSYLACDLGAESGRVILGRFAQGRLELEEIHRFSNGAIRVFGTLRWNVLGIFEELKAGLAKAAARGVRAESVSVDSWGVDYVLFGKNDPQLSIPFHYRDARSDAAYERALKKATPEIIFEHTGIQFMSINTLYQLLSEMEERPELLAAADQFLNIGDYLNYLFCGVARGEASLASTTQLFNPRSREWSRELIHLFGLPSAIFPPLAASGTVLGPLLPEIGAETGLSGEVRVIATCSHDTGCAVAAVPAEGEDWAFLSSGTWSLLGVELPAPLINHEVLAANFTNEAGIAGTTRFLKNTAGLWILQECRRAWAREGLELSYEELTRLADEAEPLVSLIDPAHPSFLKPDGMPEKIRAFCERTGQPLPGSPGEHARCIFESLALFYRQNVDTLCALTGRTIRRLHIVGGGSKNRLLNQLAANATGRTVLAGPVEATAIGNLLIQAMALGHLDSVAALRQTVRDSFPLETFAPFAGETWENAYARFLALND